MNRQIIEEAAQWFVEVNTGDVDFATRNRFDAWLRASPEHLRAFLEMLPFWEDAAELPMGPTAMPERLIEWARSVSNIVAIRSDGPLRQPEIQHHAPKRIPRRKWARLLAAAALAACVLGTALWSYQSVRYPAYATDTGEQRSLQLADGSTVELNARSKIRIRYSERQRIVDLLEGQALFHVAKDSARPFIVRSAGTQVRAVGTQFDVYKKATGTVVTVVEGRVAVLSPIDENGAAKASVRVQRSRGAENQPLQARSAESRQHDGLSYLAAGEQLTVTAGEVKKSEPANVASAIAWTQRQLVFHYTPLLEVAEEFNRYNERRLTIDAVQLAEFRISGIFSSTDPASLIHFLREQPGVKVVESDHEIHVSYD